MKATYLVFIFLLLQVPFCDAQDLIKELTEVKKRLVTDIRFATLAYSGDNIFYKDADFEDYKTYKGIFVGELKEGEIITCISSEKKKEILFFKMGLPQKYEKVYLQSFLVDEEHYDKKDKIVDRIKKGEAIKDLAEEYSYEERGTQTGLEEGWYYEGADNMLVKDIIKHKKGEVFYIDAGRMHAFIVKVVDFASPKIEGIPYKEYRYVPTSAPYVAPTTLKCEYCGTNHERNEGVFPNSCNICGAPLEED